uniref:Coatomer subunit zeta n=1 Tax=Neolamprologus brichardi TaxID=32507 RepID=A0A3Q4MJG8_NEOBR
MDSTSPEPSLYTVKAVFILDNDGNRLLSKYYDPELYPSMKEQKTFERNVFNKTHKADNEIAFLEGMTIVYKSSIDLFFYVVGSAQENELMLMSVLNCLFDSLSHILRKNVERRCLLENMEGVFLVVDEIIDGGVILESDPQQVLQKVNYRADENPLTEQSVAQVIHTQTDCEYHCQSSTHKHEGITCIHKCSSIQFSFIYIAPICNNSLFKAVLIVKSILQWVGAVLEALEGHKGI